MESEMSPTKIRTRDERLAAELLKSGHRIERDDDGKPVGWRFVVGKKEADAETGELNEGLG